MERNIEKLLHTAADMQSFSPLDDRLTRLIDRHCDNELSEFDLDYVAAAVGTPSFKDFLEQAKKK